MKERVTLIINLVSTDGSVRHLDAEEPQSAKDELAQETADTIAEVLNDLFGDAKEYGFKMIASVESAELLED